MGSASLTFLTATFIYLLSGVGAIQLKQKPLAEYISYSSVPGYFLQDSNSTNVTTFDFVGPLLPKNHFPAFLFKLLTQLMESIFSD